VRYDIYIYIYIVRRLRVKIRGFSGAKPCRRFGRFLLLSLWSKSTRHVSYLGDCGLCRKWRQKFSKTMAAACQLTWCNTSKQFKLPAQSLPSYLIIQVDQIVSVLLMITVQKITQKYFKQFQSLTMIT
jgi:hypothetical protein